jgi:hypothetical protein
VSPSEQARADAMADAETLRLVALSLSPSGPLVGTALWVVRAGWTTRLGIEHARQPAASARKHARAAFRAVPGLR